MDNLRKTKIILIHPPLDKRFTRFSVVFDKTQPIGLAYIAAVLERAGYEVKIIDAKAEQFSIDNTLKSVADFNPDIIGISCTTPEFCIATELARRIKSSGDYPLIIGGPHVSAIPEEAMQEGCFDYGVIGEGEETCLELVNAITEGRREDIPAIKGIIFKDGSTFKRTPPRPYIEDLDSIPHPARHLLPGLRRYRYSWYKYLPTATVITSRGCPYQCTFCDRAVFGNKLRLRSIGDILEEIESLVKDYGVRGIDIADDLFTITPQRVYDFCNGLQKRSLEVAWLCLGRVDRVDQKMLAAMKKAGCWQIGYGIESGNQMILDRIKKDITLEAVEKAVRWTREAGIRTMGFFMLGLPGDGPVSMQDTLNFARSLGLERISFCITRPFPGSELYRTALSQGQIKRSLGYQYYDNTGFYSNLPYVAEGLSAEMLEEYRHRFYRSFYLRPRYLLRQLINYHEFKSFPARLATFLKALF